MLCSNVWNLNQLQKQKPNAIAFCAFSFFLLRHFNLGCGATREAKGKDHLRGPTQVFGQGRICKAVYIVVEAVEYLTSESESVPKEAEAAQLCVDLWAKKDRAPYRIPARLQSHPNTK